MQKKQPTKEAGFTFAELAFSMLILVGAAVVLIDHIAVNYRTTATERDRVFAYSRAQAILAEITGFVDRGQVDAAVDLDVIDDGIVSKNTLSIQTDANGGLVAPDHVVSGNYRRDDQWVWARRITVQPFLGLNNRNVRYVTVRIFKRDIAGEEHPMADLSAVINSAGSAFPTTQVFDVYLLAIENIPGWWVFMDAIKPFVESMITDLENRNPGLKFRTHWITKAAFGRNQLYRPYTNDDTDSYAAIPDVYHYPGRMPAGNASSYYYVPDNIKARINCDGVERNGYDGIENPAPYALADFFNHGMREPDERALWQRRVDAIEAREQAIATAQALSLPVPAELPDMSKEPTLRMFFDDLCTDPDRYKNALIINLHGELVPMPAIRNFSDAARDPQSHQEWRVVTHPEELRTRNEIAAGSDADPLVLRMYAYKANVAASGDRMTDPMIVEVMGVDLTDPSEPSRIDPGFATLECVRGGVVVDGSSDYDASWQPGTPLATASHPTEEMCYEAEYVTTEGAPFTRLVFYNTPLVCTQDGTGRGLANSISARLYGMEYVPCPIDAGPAFTTDLTSTGSGTKNTARWRLTLRNTVLTGNRFDGGNPAGDVRLMVRTRIGTDYASDDTWKQSGTVYPTPIQPDNLSVTYAWWSDSKEDVPMSERSQFNGDPRHVPYKDCFLGGDDFPNSYNWYHDSLNNSGAAHSQFAGINGTYLRNRWGGAMSCDVPRYFELLRTGLVKSACVYTSLTGFSYYYMGIGNDIGYDSANGYANSIPSNMVPHGSSGNGYINTITGARRYLLEWTGSSWWTGFPWLGELYPDSAVAMWLDDTSGATRGNLPAGVTGAVQFLQYNCNTAYAISNRTAYGTAHYDYGQRTSTNGCSAFFDIGTNTSAFRHTSSSGNGSLTTTGQEVADNYAMTMPTAAPVSRPWSMTMSGAGGDHWNYPPYNTRYTGTLFNTYYTHSAGIGSGVVKLVDPGNTSAAYIVVNGIDKSVDSGTTFVAKFAVLSLTHSFLAAGVTGNTHRIQPLPRVEIESPTDITELDDPTDIDVQFSVEWSRWDGQPYTVTGSYSESEAELEYVPMYSTDNGTSWFHMQDDTPATPGERPDAAYLVPDGGTGDETYNWSVPAASFPEGSYLVRIDCYRSGAQVHYAWHQNKIFIQR